MQKHLNMKRRGRADCSNYPRFSHLEEQRKSDINLGTSKWQLVMQRLGITCFELVFQEQRIKKTKSIKTVWMSRLYWPLVIAFLVFFSASNVMPIEASRSNGLFSSNETHLSPRKKDFPSYRFISSFISHKQFDCSDSLLFKEKLLLDITFPLLGQMWFIFNSPVYGPA